MAYLKRITGDDADDSVGLAGFNEEEIKRTRYLFSLVDDFANHMKWNMVKGVMKYGPSDRPLSEWREHWDDDHADSENYRLIVEDKIRREGEAE